MTKRLRRTKRRAALVSVYSVLAILFGASGLRAEDTAETLQQAISDLAKRLKSASPAVVNSSIVQTALGQLGCDPASDAECRVKQLEALTTPWTNSVTLSAAQTGRLTTQFSKIFAVMEPKKDIATQILSLAFTYFSNKDKVDQQTADIFVSDAVALVTLLISNNKIDDKNDTQALMTGYNRLLSALADMSAKITNNNLSNITLSGLIEPITSFVVAVSTLQGVGSSALGAQIVNAELESAATILGKFSGKDDKISYPAISDRLQALYTAVTTLKNSAYVIDVAGAWFGDVEQIQRLLKAGSLSGISSGPRFCAATNAVRNFCQGRTACFQATLYSAPSAATPPAAPQPPSLQYINGKPAGTGGDISGTGLCGYEPVPFAAPSTAGLVVAYRCSAAPVEYWTKLPSGQSAGRNIYAEDVWNLVLRSGVAGELRCSGAAGTTSTLSDGSAPK